MSDTPEMPGGQPDAAVSDQGQVEPKATDVKDSVSYDSHRKLLGEKKDLQAKYEKLMEEMDSVRGEKLKAEGNKDELLKQYEDKVRNLTQTLQKTKADYGWQVVSTQLSQAASKAGCIDTEALMKLEPGFDSIEVGDNFKVQDEDVSRVIELAKDKYSYLFKKQAPETKTVTPGVDAKDIKGGGSDLSKMTLKEKTEMLAKLQLGQQ